MIKKSSCYKLTEDIRNSEYSIAYSAIETLAEMNNDEAFEILIDALQDKNQKVRAMAALGFSQIGDKRAIVPLLDSLALEPPDYHLFTNTCQAMIYIGEPAVEPLIEALFDARFLSPFQGDSRSHVLICALGEIGDKRAIDPLIKILNDPGESRVHGDVARALGKLADTRVTEFLLKALARQESQELYGVTVSIIAALGELGDVRAVQAITEQLQHDQEHVRFWAVKALGMIGDPIAIPPLSEIITDKVLRVRDCAVRSLGEIGDDQAVEPLSKALQDRNSKIRERAEKALRRIGTSKALKALNEANI